MAAIALVLGLATYGFDYYTLPVAIRVASAKHVLLKPSGRVGYRLGLLGGTLFALIYLYPLRKRWPWLQRRGKTRNWLDYHILIGLTAPVIITFHAAFKFQGVAGLSYWIMMAVVASGIAGRYLYARIPRRLDQAEMSLQEMQELNSALARQIESRHAIPAVELAPLFALPRIEEVQAMPLARALGLIVALDVKRSVRLWRIRRRYSADLGDALPALRRQAALTKDILFLSRMRQLFHLWHVIHRPFSLSFAALAILHVVVVLLLGY